MKRKDNRLFVSIATILIAAFTIFASMAPGVHAARDWGGYMWKIEGKRVYVGQISGNWKTGIRARADGGPGDTIQMGSSKSVSNSISATCGISKRVLNATFKFDVNRSWTTTASKSYGLTGKKKGSWWAILYKPVHKKYKVKSRCYSFINGKWQKTNQTKWIYAKRFRNIY